ncbi:hypothetical protein DZB91_06255 [Brevibacillus sp. VP]|nr:hypothetical protein DZB91_06255 [Brevibacillus sp. VP]TPH19531.1 hypothetical protein EGH09_06735 [Brevibacillus laterosporus]
MYLEKVKALTAQPSFYAFLPKWQAPDCGRDGAITHWMLKKSQIRHELYQFDVIFGIFDL